MLPGRSGILKTYLCCHLDHWNNGGKCTSDRDRMLIRRDGGGRCGEQGTHTTTANNTTSTSDTASDVCYPPLPLLFLLQSMPLVPQYYDLGFRPVPDREVGEDKIAASHRVLFFPHPQPDALSLRAYTPNNKLTSFFVGTSPEPPPGSVLHIVVNTIIFFTSSSLFCLLDVGTWGMRFFGCQAVCTCFSGSVAMVTHVRVFIAWRGVLVG